MLTIGRLIFADLKNSEPTVQFIDQKSRLDCHLELGLTKEKCLVRGCIYDESLDGRNTTIPLCYFPSKIGYKVEDTSGHVYLLKKDPYGFKNPYGDDFKELIFTYKEIGAGLHVMIYPSGPVR
uniref:P-type domain-containing protein n=1 Tax=Acrobeloides nanus TaxID=290746 RepID=A0A914D0Z4_9BILA